jgi:(p)ppGpp synthase/HD superfamily hydrolase
MGVALHVPSSGGALPKAHAAFEYATVLHAGQVRQVDGAPFIAHLREVAELLYGAGAPDDLIAAGALHDALEKTPATAFDLRRGFGSEVAGLVLSVSEDDRIASYAKRKAALRDKVAASGEQALMLFAADKVSKARELRAEGRRFTPRAIRDRRRHLVHYRRSLALLNERLPDSPLVRQLDIELARVSPWRTAQPVADPDGSAWARPA